MNGSEPCDAIQVRKTQSLIEWLLANRWRMPGSWRRSRLSEIDKSAHRTPPSQQLRRVFYFPERGHSKFLRRSRNGRPGSLGSRRHARARSAGPAGGNEARARHRWQSEPGRVRYGGAPLRAPRQNLFCNLLAASRGSTNAGGEDFGYFAPWEKRVRIPPLTSRTVEAAPRGPLRRGSRFFRQEGPALASLTTDIAYSPACLLQLSMRSNAPRHGGGEDVCYFGSERRPLLWFGGRVVQIPPAEMP